MLTEQLNLFIGKGSPNEKKFILKHNPVKNFAQGLDWSVIPIFDFKYFDRLSTSLEFGIKSLCYKAVPKISNYTSYANLVSNFAQPLIFLWVFKQ
ncbi:hypothetical protein VF14_36390 [Nostoc linckia z18]|jgi:hypothetical protein|uniref:Uncharacterized protein n=2 Tax=Nostoc linckia TaxID=92942 RepID=A0A9Q5ZAK8_NOSLI|nr:hypothetical protein VF02_28645 [Nostoc linckia z1]PHJ60643.1 hypothetical protein VF05_30265 [Nostoc linckia z3]PHJ65641.1 hypothetical protein VF03_27765 [Nostoc linckia z2]PHJ77158.1 hypothetical protein VF06_30615 [Nostoc linckia z4]PHJ81820.1 hypothetical protein VF07_29890 [Nostoc linckia z6]PHJ95536.1 hypothetical protein VF04_18870 [Nostoc linckia z7]PHK02204.1 hypothetical protein VF08_19685 [Nostoc linckia z8]PHK08794.1 hypothetical protein VF09_18465 [Nostoc linckia z9]PHK0973